MILNEEHNLYNNDHMNIGITYQYLMDVTVANGTFEKNKNRPAYTMKDALRDTLNEIIKEIVENTKEEFELTADSMAEAIIKQKAEEEEC